MTTKNKSILISIHPSWCDKIASGLKTVEIRKTKPKLVPPFKCYVYMTSGGWEYRDPWCTAIAPIGGKIYNGAKKVIGEFICNKIDEISVFETAIAVNGKQDNAILRESCLSFDELEQYIGYKYETKLYGWRISNVIIYETPKNLNDFERWENGDSCPYYRVQRAPQSWCYVFSK